jgi:hypothetical protein
MPESGTRASSRVRCPWCEQYRRVLFYTSLEPHDWPQEPGRRCTGSWTLIKDLEGA